MHFRLDSRDKIWVVQSLSNGSDWLNAWNLTAATPDPHLVWELNLKEKKKVLRNTIKPPWCGPVTTVSCDSQK